MPNEWYYAVDGRQAGPVAETLLKQLVGSGQIRPHDLVWREGMPEWQQAQSVPGLFAAQPSASPIAGVGANPFNAASPVTPVFPGALRPAPGKVIAVKVMMIVGAALALVVSVGLMISCFGLFWPGTYLALTTGIWGLVAGIKADRERPPKAIPILQICLIFNMDVTNLALGIVELVFLGDPEVKAHYDAVAPMNIIQ